MVRCFHSSDLHLGRLRTARQPLLHAALRHNLTQLFDRAISEKIDGILLAGDLLDNRSSEPREELFLFDLFSRAQDAGVEVFVCSGNHDAKVNQPLWERYVHLFTSPEPRVVERERFRVVSMGHLPGGDLRIDGVLPVFSDDKPTIGLFHTQVYTAEVPRGAAYHPMHLSFLESLGYDYIALGHQHSCQSLSRSSQIYYSGALSPLHPFDSAERGYLDVQIGQTPSFIPQSAVLMEEKRIVLQGEQQFLDEYYPDLYQRLRDDARLFLRVTLEGEVSYREKQAILRRLDSLPPGRVAITDRLRSLGEGARLPEEILQALQSFTAQPEDGLYRSAEEIASFYREQPQALEALIEEALLEEER